MPDFPYAHQWVKNEAIFASKGYEALTQNYLTGTQRSGSSNGVLLCAPHALNHYDAGNPKFADRGTGGLALTLGEKANVDYIIKTCKNDTPDGYAESLKRKILAFEPHLLIDLHGMKVHPESDLDIGLGPNPNKLVLETTAHFVDSFKDTPLRITVNKVFKAKTAKTLTAWAQRNSIGAFQVEIGANLRPPEGELASMETLITKLLELLGEISK